jgi:flagellar biosynthesis/type III secretory pathway protein FliH
MTVLLLAAVGVGMFFIGQGTRPSATDVTQRLSAAVAKQRHSDTVSKTSALRHQKTSLARMFHRREARTAKTAFNRGRSKGRDEGYKNGQNVGFASGKSAGHSEGVQEGQAQGYAQGNLDGFFQGLDSAYYGE